MTPDWLVTGRPKLAIALLALAGLSILMLLYEGSRAPADLGLPSFRGLDKLLHFGAHFWVSSLMFAGLILFGRPAGLRPRVWLAAAAVLLVDGLSGLMVELVQAHIATGRTFDWFDLAANLAGTCVALAAGVPAVRRMGRAAGAEFR
jgi:hypothetical protein